MKALAPYILEIIAWLVVVLGIIGSVLAIASSAGCDRLGAMQPPADPWAVVTAAAEAERICADAARVCDTCEQPPGPTSAEVLLSPCALMCIDAVRECTEASEALAQALGPDAGAGGGA